jgi:para-aminobenzoate synthetase component 1
VLLDGGGTDSWRSGCAIYADSPLATLTVFASGWGCWRTRSSARWCWGDPFAQWQQFLDGDAVLSPRSSGRPADGGGGVLTVLSYDLKHAVERLPRRLPWPREPLLFAARYDWSYRYDYRTHEARITAADDVALAERLRWYAGQSRAPDAEHAIRRGGSENRPSNRSDVDHSAASVSNPAVSSVLSEAEYLAMVSRAQEYIAAGDIYQANLAQPFTAATGRRQAPDLFAAWVERYPMPFAAFVDGGEWTLVSNSPECFLAVDAPRVATLPIKGTCAVTGGAGAAAVAERLQRDPKERAEHVMIVDLERNDLGRVCRIGSIAVAQLAAVRQYPVVAHMESEVEGQLRPGTSLAALLRATFPGGSISGAPKIRAMQIIEELEPAPRGLYTGAIGWTEGDGRSRFSIAIRTAVLRDAGLTYWAGGGIVADSDPKREYDETLLKSDTLLRALRSLERSRACEQTATYS